MKIRLLLLITLLPITLYAHASKEPLEIIQSFFSSIKQNEVDPAYNQILSGADVFNKQDKIVSELIQRTKNIQKKYGAIIGYDLVKKQQYGNLSKITYVLKSKKYVTAWEFTFYKPESKWFLLNMGFTDGFISNDKGVRLIGIFGII